RRAMDAPLAPGALRERGVRMGRRPGPHLVAGAALRNLQPALDRVRCSAREAAALEAPGMILVLPYPVSANRYWQSYVPKGWTRAIVHPSTEAKRYKAEIGWLAKQAGFRRPVKVPIRLHFTLCPKARKDGTPSDIVLDL